MRNWGILDQLAILLQALGLICAVEEFPLEELNCDDSKDEHEEDVNDEDVKHILQRVDHTVEHGLRTQKYTHIYIKWEIISEHSWKLLPMNLQALGTLRILSGLACWCSKMHQHVINKTCNK